MTSRRRAITGELRISSENANETRVAFYDEGGELVLAFGFPPGQLREGRFSFIGYDVFRTEAASLLREGKPKKKLSKRRKK